MAEQLREPSEGWAQDFKFALCRAVAEDMGSGDADADGGDANVGGGDADSDGDGAGDTNGCPGGVDIPTQLVIPPAIAGAPKQPGLLRGR